MLTPDLAIYISWVNFSAHNGLLWVHHFWWWGHSCVKFLVNGSSKPFAPRFLCSSTLALNLGGDAQTFAQNTPGRCFHTTEQTEVHLTFNFIFSFPPKKLLYKMHPCLCKCVSEILRSFHLHGPHLPPDNCLCDLTRGIS